MTCVRKRKQAQEVPHGALDLGRFGLLVWSERTAVIVRTRSLVRLRCNDAGKLQLHEEITKRVS